MEDDVSVPLQQEVEYGDGPDESNDSSSANRIQVGESAMEENVESGVTQQEVDNEFEDVPNDSSSIKSRHDFEEEGEARLLSKRHRSDQ